jgi:enoyl-CoA hydratase/carnithine racemase
MRRSHRWRASLLSADKPVITAVNGVAAGGIQGR